MDKIFIHEVGPRDGLQGERTIVPLQERIRWIEIILDSGIDIIQLGSFVNPEKVPQMADTEALFTHFADPAKRPPRLTLSALVLNEKGLDRGLAAGADMLCMGVSASRTHSLKNTGMTPEQALPRIQAMLQRALRRGKAGAGLGAVCLWLRLRGADCRIGRAGHRQGIP